MGKGYGLVMGMSEYTHQDWKGYEDILTPLPSVKNDVEDFLDYLKSKGYSCYKLFNEDLTVINFVRSVVMLAGQAVSGDVVVLFFAGHGDSLVDVNGYSNANGDEDGDLFDSGYYLYDGNIFDDFVTMLIKTFREGVKVYVISDSCYSDTMVDEDVYKSFTDRAKEQYAKYLRDAATSAFVPGVNAEELQLLKRLVEVLNKKDLDASVCEIAAVSKLMLARSGVNNGILTDAILDCLKDPLNKDMGCGDFILKCRDKVRAYLTNVVYQYALGSYVYGGVLKSDANLFSRSHGDINALRVEIERGNLVAVDALFELLVNKQLPRLHYRGKEGYRAFARKKFLGL